MAVAPVAAQSVAIVTGFLCIDRSIAATSSRAVQAAGSGNAIVILRACVALFACIERRVPAEEREVSAIRAATVGEGRVMQCRFALFAEETLEHGVAAAAGFEVALAAAAVEVTTVCVVTFLPLDEHRVAAARQVTSFECADSRAPVAVSLVAVFTLLVRLKDAVAAGDIL